MPKFKPQPKPKKGAVKVQPKKPGRPRYRRNEKDCRIIEAMIGAGDKIDDVAAVIGIAPNTMRKHYPEELALSRTKMLSSIKQTIFREALKGNTTLLIWVSKSQMGWQEPPKTLNIPGVGVGAQQDEVVNAENVNIEKPEQHSPAELVAFYRKTVQDSETVH